MFVHYKNFINKTFRDAQRSYLLAALKEVLPREPATILDIGAADGAFAAMMQREMPHLDFRGVEVIPRGEAHIPITLYDGGTIPFEDKTFDYCTLINMLHHTDDVIATLKEALRVSRKGIIIKDHYADNWLDDLNLRMMEYANPNSRLLIRRPLTFYSRGQWQHFFETLGLTCSARIERFPSYGPFWDIFFGRDMHFIGRYHLKDRG